MFSLIITIISIALVAALALATLYFGGDAFNQGSAKASASTLVNQASQISAANTLHFIDHQEYAPITDGTPDDGAISGVNLLDGGYLASMPNPGTAGSAYTVAGAADSKIVSEDIPTAVCVALNEQSGATTTTPWTSGSPSNGIASAEAELDGVQFGCYDNSGTNTFIYK